MKQLKQELIGKVLTSSMYDEIQAEALELMQQHMANPKKGSLFATGYRMARKHIRLHAERLRRGVDACEVCHGANGGIPGNENIIDDVTVCDYCHVAKLREGER